MKNAKTTTATRAVTLSRLVLSLLVALVLGAMLVPSVDATKAGKNTIKSVKTRMGAQRDLCEIQGGTLVVNTAPSGAKVTTCRGGESDGYRCVNNEKTTACHQSLTTPPPSVQDDVPAPLGDAGVLDEPTSGANTVGPPPGGQIAAQADDDGKRDQDKHHGKRNRH